MSSPLLKSLVLAAAVASAAAAPAAAQEDVLLEADGPVHWAKALNRTTLVAIDRAGRRPDRVRRVLDDEVLPARHLTEPGQRLVDVEPPGRLARRVVFPVLRADADGRRWFLYDAGRDAAKPLRGLPTGRHTPRHVAIWRGVTVYEIHRGARAGVYWREGGKARRISRLRSGDWDDPLVLRGATLVLLTADAGETSLWRLVARGAIRPQRVEPSLSDFDHEFSVRGAWLTGTRLNWWMESTGSGGNLVLSTDPEGDVATTEARAFLPTTFERPLAFEGDFAYTADDRGTVYRRPAGRPVGGPPANDVPADAQVVTGTLPFPVGARIGAATRTADEPAVTGLPAGGAAPVEATRTVWYAYEPAVARRVTILGSGEDYRGGTLTGGAMSVYEQDAAGRLTELPKAPAEVGATVTFDADPARRYLIGVGADTPGAAWPTFTLRFLQAPAA